MPTILLVGNNRVWMNNFAAKLAARRPSDQNAPTVLYAPRVADAERYFRDEDIHVVVIKPETAVRDARTNLAARLVPLLVQHGSKLWKIILLLPSETVNGAHHCNGTEDAVAVALTTLAEVDAHMWRIGAEG